ncbi:WYL domain-containing protein [Aerococcaceae bacterium DSM 111176]|nr:WYL domain-containing protein [Aerococcaceae bacterium DSM 111176]
MGKVDKGFRLLAMYERLNRGELLVKEELEQEFNVTPKTVQRDIDDLRAYLAENHSWEIDTYIKYDRIKGGYFLVRFEREWLTNAEVLTVSKILLESRAFNKKELELLINKLLAQVTPKDRQHVNKIIFDEKSSYVPPRHGRDLIDSIWEISEFISMKEQIQITYQRQDGRESKRVIQPLAIMFSEYYFYLIAYILEADTPTVFRIDRVLSITQTNTKFKLPYADKFDEGEFRNRVQFMYPGDLEEVTFEFSGPSLEAILDRLPTARVINESDGVYTIKVETFGKGIYMWLRTQGEHVRIVEK